MDICNHSFELFVQTNKNLQNAVMVLGIHRSQSELDIQSVGSTSSFTTLDVSLYFLVLVIKVNHIRKTCLHRQLY